MSSIPGYPKIYPVGSSVVPDLFKGLVEITEKIDGSMFCFGVSGDKQIVMRSKGKELFFESYEKMFKLAVDWVRLNSDRLLAIGTDRYYYAEFLMSPKHNVLSYSRVPKNNLILFGITRGQNMVSDYDELVSCAERLGLEAVPLLYSGEIRNQESLDKFLKRESVLGNAEIEGIVIKNYNVLTEIGGRTFPSFGKYVRPQFKEQLAVEWKSGKNKLDEYIESFRTEARWQKAVQHLRDGGRLINGPQDIGPLLKEIELDLIEEEKENIKERLFWLFKDQIVRKAKAGLPEWYKEQLARRAFL